MAKVKDKILIIDDDDILVNAIQDVFSYGGFEVIGLTKGKEALQVFNDREPNVIIVDIAMPKFDGLDFLKQVKKSKTGAAVILTSGQLDKLQDEVKEIKRKGLIDSAIEKPVSFKDLEQLIYQLLNASKKKPPVNDPPKATILLVDDETEVTDLFEEILKKRGFAVIVTNSAKDGLKAYKKFKPDAVITDIILIDKDGFWLINEIKKIDPKAVVVAMTAQDNQGFINRLNDELGEQKYLQKPFGLEDLHNLTKKLERDIKARN